MEKRAGAKPDDTKIAGTIGNPQMLRQGKNRRDGRDQGSDSDARAASRARNRFRINWFHDSANIIKQVAA